MSASSDAAPSTSTADADTDTDLSEADSDELAARIEVLREENQRLRREYRRATQTTYRRTALALGVVGVVAALAGVVVPNARQVLLIVGAIGVFGGVLTWYLTPERVLAATVSEGLYATHAATVGALVGELGLQEERVYVPADAPDETARLFVPLHREYRLPDDVADRLFVTGEDDRERGVALPPNGGPLYRELEASGADIDGRSVDAVLPVLGDAVVEQFELATGVETEVDDGRATITVDDPVPDAMDRPDHPVVSLVAVGLAVGRDGPVTVSNVDGDENEATFTWDVDNDTAAGDDGAEGGGTDEGDTDTAATA